MLNTDTFVGNQSLLFDAIKPGNYTRLGVNNSLWLDWNEVYSITSEGMEGASCKFGQTPVSERFKRYTRELFPTSFFNFILK